MKRRAFVIVSLILLLAVSGIILAVIKQSAMSVESGRSTHTLYVDGNARNYRLYVPAGVSDGTPLVVMLHGALGTGEQAETSYGWDQKADKGKFIVAYPDGIKRSWAVSRTCCGPPAKQGVNDIRFIEEMVADLKKNYPVNENAIYAAGISNGGALAYRLACDTRIFAAIGVVSATLLGDCPNPPPLSVMHIHGTSDQTFPYTGGSGKRNNDGQGDRPADTSGPPIPELMETWRKSARCEAPTISINGSVTESIAHCADDREVALITIEGAGHQWPGSTSPRAAQILGLDQPSTALIATDELWAFFARH